MTCRSYDSKQAFEGPEGERGVRFAAFYTPRATTTERRPQSEVNVLLAFHTDEERSNVDHLLADPAANLAVRGLQRGVVGG